MPSGSASSPDNMTGAVPCFLTVSAMSCHTVFASSLLALSACMSAKIIAGSIFSSLAAFSAVLSSNVEPCLLYFVVVDCDTSSSSATR